MRIDIYILSMAILFNMGTHVKLLCETPKCAMSSTASCSCSTVPNHSDSCCKTEVKCETSNLDGSLISDAEPIFYNSVILYACSIPLDFSNSLSVTNIFSNSDPPPKLTLSSTYKPLLI
jgi:hypothetical protein